MSCVSGTSTLDAFAVGIQKAYAGIRENAIVLGVVLLLLALLVFIGITMLRMAIKTFFLHKAMFPAKQVEPMKSLDDEQYAADVADERMRPVGGTNVRKRIARIKAKYADYNRTIATKPGGDQAVVDERILDRGADDFEYPKEEAEDEFEVKV